MARRLSHCFFWASYTKDVSKRSQLWDYISEHPRHRNLNHNIINMSDNNM